MTAWSPAALKLLESYGWPGNVRELRNVVHRAYVMTEGDTILPDVVQELLPGAGSGSKPARPARPQEPKALRGPDSRKRPPPILAAGTGFALGHGGAVWAPERKQGHTMLWTIFVILLVLWLLGLVSGYTLSGFIHILLVIAVVVLIINLVSGRRVA